jgi:hypothetical protein
MERRELLKIVAWTALTQKLNALPGSMMMPMQAPPATPPAPAKRFFTDDETQFLDEVMEMIIPADEHSPGAHAAQTNVFADLMVGISADAVQKKWRDGIRLFQQQAKGSSAAEVLHTVSLNEEHPKTDLDHFFVLLKSMTVDGYYTSAIGIHQEMEYQGNKYLGAFPGCPHPEHQDA